MLSYFRLLDNSGVLFDFIKQYNEFHDVLFSTLLFTIIGLFAIHQNFTWKSMKPIMNWFRVIFIIVTLHIIAIDNNPLQYCRWTDFQPFFSWSRCCSLMKAWKVYSLVRVHISSIYCPSFSCNFWKLAFVRYSLRSSQGSSAFRPGYEKALIPISIIRSK